MDIHGKIHLNSSFLNRTNKKTWFKKCKGFPTTPEDGKIKKLSKHAYNAAAENEDINLTDIIAVVQRKLLQYNLKEY